MKYIYVITDNETPTMRYYMAECIPCDEDILHFLNNASRAGKTLHAYPCGTWAEAQKLAEAWNNANRY